MESTSSTIFHQFPFNKPKIIAVSSSSIGTSITSLSPSIPLPRFEFTSPVESSREPSPSGGEESFRNPLLLNQKQQNIVKPIGNKDNNIIGGGNTSSIRSAILSHNRLTRRQFSDNTLRPSLSLSPNGLTVSGQSTSMDSNRRHSGGQSRVSLLPDKRDQQQQQQQRLPLRAFKPTPNSSTLSSSRTAAVSVFHQRWGVGNSGNRRGSHLIGGWDSARPHSAARQQQQMLERLYTKGELKEYQQLFKMFDTDGSGAIGREELKGAMLRIGLEADDEEIERLIKEVDEDGNGEIDFPEFCQCMKTAERQGGFRQKPTNDEVVRQYKNGLISENEFIYVAKEIGGFSHELAELVFKELLGDSSADQLDMDRFSAIVEDYLSDNNNENKQENIEEEIEE